MRQLLSQKLVIILFIVLIAIGAINIINATTKHNDSKLSEASAELLDTFTLLDKMAIANMNEVFFTDLALSTKGPVPSGLLEEVKAARKISTALREKYAQTSKKLERKLAQNISRESLENISRALSYPIAVYKNHISHEPQIDEALLSRDEDGSLRQEAKKYSHYEIGIPTVSLILFLELSQSNERLHLRLLQRHYLHDAAKHTVSLEHALVPLILAEEPFQDPKALNAAESAFWRLTSNILKVQRSGEISSREVERDRNIPHAYWPRMRLHEYGGILEAFPNFYITKYRDLKAPSGQQNRFEEYKKLLLADHQKTIDAMSEVMLAYDAETREVF